MCLGVCSCCMCVCEWAGVSVDVCVRTRVIVCKIASPAPETESDEAFRGGMMTRSPIGGPIAIRAPFFFLRVRLLRWMLVGGKVRVGANSIAVVVGVGVVF